MTPTQTVQDDGRELPYMGRLRDEDQAILEQRWTANVRAMQAVLVEQDMERARLRGRIFQLEQIIDAAGLIPLHDGGESMAAMYRTQAHAIAAVFDYFNAGNYTLNGLPPELHEAFRPLLVT
jgi:hypothetical protein